MIVNVNKKILIVGLGLLGGSYAKALKRFQFHISAITKEPLLEQINLFINKFNELRLMLENEDVDSMRKMMRHSTERRALFDKE